MARKVSIHRGPDPDLTATVARVMREHHAMLSECEVRVVPELVWRDDDRPTLTLYGYPVPSQSKAVGHRNRKHGNPDIFLDVDKGTWDLLDEEGRDALIHHELCKYEVKLDEDGAPVIHDESLRPQLVRKAPDLIVEVFDEVLDLYGSKAPCFDGLQQAGIRLAKRQSD